jgi:hypothetical protein
MLPRDWICVVVRCNMSDGVCGGGSVYRAFLIS